jgi:uncharacterized protein (DUF1800 family)
MRTAPALILAIALIAHTPTAAAIPQDEAAIVHALNRLTFGARPGDVARVRSRGLARWIEDQLTPRPTQDSPPAMPPLARRPEPGELRRLLAEAADAKLRRALHSDRQLEEVLVDFWFNHFNVFARKGPTGLFVRDHEDRAIRPHVFSRFRDLLGATARSPAMLIYLDNWQSNDRRGLNENYARELLELHTLGVEGGYTQLDVINVARAFTGWTVARDGSSGFRFATRLHDREAKRVLGVDMSAGGGIDDGERVLDIVARHPSTARHIALKLSERFVSNTAPATLVERAAKRFATTHGNLREVVRVIVTSPEFFDPAVRQQKIKTPLEFVVSALRASDAEVVSTGALVRALADMGMPLYLCQPPTGYDETADSWVSSGALVNRINFAMTLSSGQVPGVRVPAGARDRAEFGSAAFQRQ